MPDDVQKFTNHANKVLFLSQDAAEKLGINVIEPMHMLLGMTRLPECVAFHVLNEHDIVEEKLLPYIKVKLSPESDTVSKKTLIDLSIGTKKVLELAVDTARRKGQDYIASEHLLIGIMRLESETITDILTHFDVKEKDIIKSAEYYLNIRSSTEQPQKPRKRQYVKSKTNETGFLSSIMGFFGFNDKQDDE